MRLALPEFTSPDQNASGLDLNGRAILSQLNERAVAESNRSRARDFGDLVARTPKRTVAETNNPAVRLLHFHHGGIVSMKRSKFPIRDQEAVGRALLCQNRSVAIIGTGRSSG